MTWRPPALAAALLVVPAVLLPAAPAPAQACQPPSAEHAFEELLDVAEDDSPLEDEAWRIADEQEARGVFESPETVQRIDELARANGLVYDCASRMYFPVSGPDPREAIENGEEPPEAGGGPPAGSTGQPEPGTTAPEARNTGEPGRQPGPAPEETAAVRGTGGMVPDPGGGVRAPDGAGPAGTAGRTQSPGAAGAPGEDGVPRPLGAPDGQGGAIALPDGADEPAGQARTAGVLLAAAAVAVMLTGAGANRRRRSRQLT